MPLHRTSGFQNPLALSPENVQFWGFCSWLVWGRGGQRRNSNSDGSWGALGPQSKPSSSVCPICLPSPHSPARQCDRQMPLMPRHPTSHIIRKQRVTLFKSKSLIREEKFIIFTSYSGPEKPVFGFLSKH